MNAPTEQVFRSAAVWTGDPRLPNAAAFAVAHGRFTRVGREADVVRSAARGAEIIDLGGATVVPGFHDAHTHLSAGALTASWVDLREAPGPRAAAQRVAAAARSVPAGEWIRGWGWDQTRWDSPVWPSRTDLDDLVGGHPVLLTRADGHVVWLNGAALARLGWERRTPDPEGGTILRDPLSGEPTGIALEKAAELTAAALPPPSDLQRREAVEWGLAQARAHGVTALEDVAEPWALDAYARLREAGALTARVQAWLPFDGPRREAAELRRRYPSDDEWLGCGTLKIFLDGTLGSRSAAMHEPYFDAPGVCGKLREDPRLLLPRMVAADGEGWALALHAIGDRAVTHAADLLSRLPARRRTRPHRVEHVQVARPRDIARMAGSGVVASVQPIHFLDDAHWIEARLGSERAAAAYPLRSLLAAGVSVAFGTDWPIAALDPLANVLAASLRRARYTSPAGREAVSLSAALSAATYGSARARGATDLGRIAPGYHADFVVLGGDLFRADPDRSQEPVTVAATYVAGRRVHSAEGAP